MQNAVNCHWNIFKNVNFFFLSAKCQKVNREENIVTQMKNTARKLLIFLTKSPCSIACTYSFILNRLVSFQLLATSKQCTVSLLFGDRFIILLDYLLMVYLTPKTQIKSALSECNTWKASVQHIPELLHNSNKWFRILKMSVNTVTWSVSCNACFSIAFSASGRE